MKLHPFLLTALLVPGFAGPSRADVLFSNLGQPDNGAAGFNNLDELLATDFLTDPTPRTITGLTVRLANSSNELPLTISFSIYTDTGSGVPDALLSAFDAPVLVPAGGSGNFTTTSLGINLQANTPYWLVGQLTPLESLGTVTWRFDLGEGTDSGPFTTVPTTQFMHKSGLFWIPSDFGNFIYSLEGTEIPEPSTLPVVVITGTFGAFGWWRRRRRVSLDRLPDRGLAS